MRALHGGAQSCGVLRARVSRGRCGGTGVKPSEALEVLAFVRLIWRLPVPRDAKDDLDLVVWPNELADIDYEDAQTAVRRFNSSNFPPTVLQLANVASAESHFRAGRLELPQPDGCSFAEYLEHATEEDRQRLARTSPKLREKYGIELAGLEEPA